MSSLLLFYAFDYTLLFLTMDRYPFVDFAFAYYESPLNMDVDVYVLSPSLGDDLGRGSIYLYMMG